MSEITKELDIGCRPEAAVSGGAVVQTEHSTFLTFNAMRRMNDGLYHPVGTALVEFPLCLITQFGYPNDEARLGIPRYKDVAYGIYEVANSDWIKELVRLNRFAFPNTKDDATSRHFLIAFHDSTFECIAADIKLELIQGPYEDVFGRIAARVLAE